MVVPEIVCEVCLCVSAAVMYTELLICNCFTMHNHVFIIDIISDTMLQDLCKPARTKLRTHLQTTYTGITPMIHVCGAGIPWLRLHVTCLIAALFGKHASNVSDPMIMTSDCTVSIVKQL